MRYNIREITFEGGWVVMVRLIKRYESRKLYDTEESRYVSLSEIAEWIREGQEVKVIDNATSEDVTSQVLTKIILEEGKKKGSIISARFLHNIIRVGGETFSLGVKRLQNSVDSFLVKSLDNLTPIREVREKMAHLRKRLEELEKALEALENERFLGSREVDSDRNRKNKDDRR